MSAVADAKEKGRSRLTRSINYWTNSLSKNARADYNDVLVEVMRDVATYLNRYTSELGDYRIAIPVVAKMFNLEPSVVKTVFYEKGAIIQAIADFDMDMSKQGHADNLLRATEEYIKSGSEFNAAKNAILEMAKGMRTKNPQHRKTLIDIINQAQGFEQLRGGLMQAKLSFEGMGVNMPLMATRHATITVVLPWQARNTIKAAQNAARLGRVQVKGGLKGFEVRGTIHRLADLGIVHQGDARGLLGNVRQAGVSTMEGRTWDLPGGQKAVEIMTRVPARVARLLAKQLVATRDLAFATIYDNTGVPHTVAKSSRKACGDMIPGGKADGVPGDYFDPFQLGMGIQHELEHTDDPALAQEIAEDHLMDEPKYYEKLLRIEASRIGCPLDAFKKEFKEELSEFATKLDQQTYEENEDDFHNLIQNLRHFNNSYQASKRRVPVERSEGRRVASVTPRRASALTTGLQKVWEQLSEELADAMDSDQFEATTVQEFVGDNAGSLLEGSALKEWNDLDSEGRANALAEAFPQDQDQVVRGQLRHYWNQQRGAAKVREACGCGPDPTDILPQDDDFEGVFQEMILEPRGKNEDQGVVIIEFP